MSLVRGKPQTRNHSSESQSMLSGLFSSEDFFIFLLPASVRATPVFLNVSIECPRVRGVPFQNVVSL